MREIEFRGKAKHNNDWYFGYLNYSQSRKEHYIMDDVSSFPISAYEETIGQYTGLKDKNGVKIFEGDIVKLQEGHKSYYIVKWHEKYCFWHFQFIIKPKEYYRFKDIEKNFGRGNGISKIEIIGNIHDSPELLGGE